MLGMLAVILGAFGAHGLKDRISAYDLENWKTAVSYQFFHVLALLFLATMSGYRQSYVTFAFYAFVIGIVLFSGSLYLLSTKAITGVRWKILGPVTPIGGLMFILGWGSILLGAIKGK